MHLSPIVVLKFGSSVLSSVDAMPRVVREIWRHIEQGQRVVAIVSAFAGVTDKLLETLHQVDVKADSYRIADFVSTGERQSALLLSIALERLGLITKLLGPADIGLRAEGLVLDADPDQLDVSALRSYLRDYKVIVLPGFIACDERGRTVLLGRGGSDDSALFVAQRLRADCRLVKDVDGIFERDPAIAGPLPRRFATITWTDAIQVAGELVQSKAIRFAAAHDMRFEVSALATTGGTLVGAGPSRYADVTASTGEDCDQDR